MVLKRWIVEHHLLLLNAASLFGTTVVTSGLGFVYWWSAARLFSPGVVGLSSAAISAMMLLGAGGTFGLETLLVGELPRQRGREATLISAALLLVAGTGGASGILLASSAPFISRELAPLGANLEALALFAAGASLTAVTMVLDQAMIGLARGGMQLFRNTLFSAAKLALIVAVGLWLSHPTWLTIYATWTAASALSLLALGGYTLLKRGGSSFFPRPHWKLLWRLEPAALQHHVLNLILRAPGLVLPLLVTILLSVTMSARFYVAFMMANVVLSVPLALTTVLFAAKHAGPKAIAQKTRLTLFVSLLLTLFGVLVLCLCAQQLLELFGQIYAEQAVWCLRLLGLAVFPLILKNHYIVLCRIHNQMAQTMFPLFSGLLLELGSAALGAYLAGLMGLSLGWLIVLSIEAVFMAPRVLRAICPAELPFWAIRPWNQNARTTEEGLH